MRNPEFGHGAMRETPAKKRVDVAPTTEMTSTYDEIPYDKMSDAPEDTITIEDITRSAADMRSSDHLPQHRSDMRLDRNAPSEKLPEKMSVVDDDDVFANPPDKGVFQTIREKIVDSRFGKVLMLMGAIGAGAGGKAGAESYSAAEHRLEQRDAIGNAAKEIALQSRYDRTQEMIQTHADLPKDSDVLTLADGTSLTRGELSGLLNDKFTEMKKAENNGSYAHFSSCADDNGVLDMAKCFDMYGFEAVQSQKSLEALSLATGYTLQELMLHNKMTRESIVHVDEKGGWEFYNKFETASQMSAHAETLFDGHYDLASDLLFATIKELDLTHATPEAQRAATDALSLVIHGEIDFTNGLTLAANDIEHLDLPINQEGLTHDQELLETAQHSSKAGCKVLEKLSTQQDGVLQNLDEYLTNARDAQLQALETQANSQRANLGVSSAP